jgi:hypothetical protein
MGYSFSPVLPRVVPRENPAFSAGMHVQGGSPVSENFTQCGSRPVIAGHAPMIPFLIVVWVIGVPSSADTSAAMTR